jgi:hypothetical protein
MKQQTTIGRREFTVGSALALLSGVTITLTGCGGGSDPAGPSGTQPTSSTGDKTGSISANHGHTAVITTAEITAGNALALGIQGSSNHPHGVDISADELSRIGNGERVSKDSSNDQGHSHTITFN